MLNVRRKEDGKIYQAIPQSVDLNFNGRYVLRYIIGIQGYDEFHFIHAVYSNDEFNELYDVVEWNEKTKTWELTFRL